MPNNVSFGVQAKGVQKASSDLDNLKDKFANLQKQGAKGIGIGIAAGATSFALGAASQAVSQLTDVIGDSIKAAIEDEESQNRLRASLLTNVPAWNGNTDAIEKNIAAKEKLGFEDNDLRDSLTVLVGATHDVAKAQEIQNTAMDLARFKGISLKDASEALIKVEAGQYRSLKSLGIVLKEGATQTDALAAVQKVAAGQAEAYANTTSGKMQIAQVAINEAMESFGYTILPVVSQALVDVARTATDVASVMDTLEHGFSNDSDAASDQAKSILDLAGAFGILIPGMSQLADASKKQIDDQAKLRDTYDANAAAVHDMHASDQKDFDAEARASEHMQRSVVGAFGKVTYASSKWQENYHIDSGKIIRDANKVRDQLATDAQAMIDSYFDPIEKRADLHNTRMQTIADEKTKRNAKTKEDSRQAADAITQDLDDEATALSELGSQGKLTKTDIDRFAADAKKAYGKIPPAIQAIIDHLRTLQKSPDIDIGFKLTPKTPLTKAALGAGFTGNQDLYKKNPFRAAGGPVNKNEPYIVGEKGPEIMVPDSAGKIIPNGGATGGSAVGGITVIVNAGIGASFSAAEGRRLADAILPPLLAGMQRRGIVSRTGTGLTG